MSKLHIELEPKGKEDLTMDISGTTAEERCMEHLGDARAEVAKLRDWLSSMDKELERAIKEGCGRAFPISWGSVMMERALAVYNEIARCNGASLVRAKPEE